MRALARGSYAAIACTAVGLLGCAGVPPQQPEAVLEDIFDPRGDVQAVDARGQFRELFCNVTAAKGDSYPDNRPCDESLRLISPEGRVGTGEIPLDQVSPPFTVLFVPGLGYDCVASLIGDDQELIAVAESLGHSTHTAPIKGLSETDENARIVGDTVRKLSVDDGTERLLLIGYSKGINDILSALVTYPDVADRVAAVVSISGAVGGSELAQNVDLWMLNLLTGIPGSECDAATQATLESLYPETRSAWLREHALPDGPMYFSVVSYPQPERVSAGLRQGFRKLAESGGDNDGQVRVTDQVVPGSEVLAFVNADHWAIALPIARTHGALGSTVLNRNDFPREVLLEAILQYVDARIRSLGTSPN